MRSLSLEQISKRIRSGILGVGRVEILAWGTVALGVLALLILLFDGYLFYYTVISKERPRGVLEKKPTSLGVYEVDELIRALDDRQKKFEEILRTR